MNKLPAVVYLQRLPVSFLIGLCLWIMMLPPTQAVCELSQYNTQTQAYSQCLPNNPYFFIPQSARQHLLNCNLERVLANPQWNITCPADLLEAKKGSQVTCNDLVPCSGPSQSCQNSKTFNSILLTSLGLYYAKLALYCFWDNTTQNLNTQGTSAKNNKNIGRKMAILTPNKLNNTLSSSLIKPIKPFKINY